MGEAGATAVDVGRTATAVLADGDGRVAVGAVPPQALPTNRTTSAASASLMDMQRWRLQHRFGPIAKVSCAVTPGTFDYVGCHAQSRWGLNLNRISSAALAGAPQKSSASYSRQSCASIGATCCIRAIAMAPSSRWYSRHSLADRNLHLSRS